MEQIQKKEIEKVKEDGATVNDSMKSVGAAASMGVGMVVFCGFDIVQELMGVLIVIKFLGRLKLVNISYGVILEIFLS